MNLTACSRSEAPTGNPPELGSLFYPVYGYDRDTGECIGGPDSSGWNGDGGPILLEPMAGFNCFGWPEYQEATISLMEEHGFDIRQPTRVFIYGPCGRVERIWRREGMTLENPLTTASRRPNPIDQTHRRATNHEPGSS